MNTPRRRTTSLTRPPSITAAAEERQQQVELLDIRLLAQSLLGIRKARRQHPGHQPHGEQPQRGSDEHATLSGVPDDLQDELGDPGPTHPPIVIARFVPGHGDDHGRVRLEATVMAHLAPRPWLGLTVPMRRKAIRCVEPDLPRKTVA